MRIESHREFPFPHFLYAVLFFFSGLAITFNFIRMIAYNFIRFDFTLWGLVNVYLLPYSDGWVGTLASISGIISTASAVLVFIRKKYSRQVIYANLVFGVFVGSLGFIAREMYRAPILSGTYLSLAVFIGVNAAWFSYFRKDKILP